MSATEPESGKEFASYLSKRLKKNLICKDIQRIFGGASRETYKVRLYEKEVDKYLNVIYRKSQESSLIETDQETEYLAYQAFQNSHVPVPKLIVLEKSSKPLGAPFLVMEELSGQSYNPFDKDAYKPYQKEIGEQFWSILGKISSTNISKKGLDKKFDVPSPEKLWKKELDYWVSVIRSDSMGVEPILEAAIRKLYRSPPSKPERIGLIHGDYRNGNFLIDKDTITGILDWEMAHLGDPLEDLAWALSPIWCWEENLRPAYLISRDEGLDIWKRNSKIDLNEDSLTWWELFACVKGMAIWISAGNEFLKGKNTDPVNLFSAWVPGDIHTEIILNLMESRVN